MKPFVYTRAGDVASDAPDGSDATVLAGGTDLVPSMKVGLVAPTRIVDVKSGGPLTRGIERTDAGWRIGALTTLADLGGHADLAAALPVVHETARQSATRQIRNRATVGGNLLQRSRCAYFRDPEIDCWLKGGDDCPARSGVNEHHAIVETGPCATTQPSDLASALVALDATITYTRTNRAGPETCAVADLLAPPTDDRRRLHTLPDDALIESVEIPVGEAPHSTYLKAMDRAAWQFALVGLAAVRDETGVRLVASGVAATPWRLAAAERALADGVDDDSIERAVEAAADGTNPLSDNTYKVSLLRGLLRRALHSLA